MQGLGRFLRDVLPPIALILAIDLVVTVVFLVVSGAPTRIGTLRAANTVPAKVMELLLVGGAVGMLACISERRLDYSILALAVAFVVIIDIDHLPSALGIAQPIRPAHTFAFLALETVALGLTFRKRPELPLLAVAAWFAHLAGDTGVFALFAPLSFAYASLGPYRVLFGIIAVLFATATGIMARRRQRAKNFT